MPQMPMPVPGAQDPMGADPIQMISEIRSMLDQLEQSLGAGPAEEAVEFEPQDNADVMAGIPPRKKSPFPMGA
jgi:hypothetical protein